MEIIKNDKKYFYPAPSYGDYSKLVEILSDLDIELARISYKYCYVFSSKKILTKLKKYFKNRVEYKFYDGIENPHIYMITLLNDEEYRIFIDDLKEKEKYKD